jgi:phospholipid/cholesterol/gamma-HCH transport system permease protein
MTLHTRSTLVMFGARAMIPRVQSVAFFIKIGPLVAGLLVAGRGGAGIGAVLANMRAAEQYRCHRRSRLSGLLHYVHAV